MNPLFFDNINGFVVRDNLSTTIDLKNLSYNAYYWNLPIVFNIGPTIQLSNTNNIRSLPGAQVVTFT